ncbi:DUF5689 domain-containing protein [Aestuariivivens insulae]|uniref:DUF5689 domain-containing protein n=1 Tax=Aestuariivivens insulae TaxID=1621988 RepID=UPI001F586749|nr:DUF5689 domain-containing protein [Aestuariivivens insulae]
MRINTFLTGLLASMLSLTSCVQDNDYAIPESLGKEEHTKLNELLGKIESNEVQLKAIDEVKALFVNGEARFLESEIAVKGYVSSSDRTGNFYKEFFIQDSPENPTAALKVVINQSNTYNQFNVGREVYLYLKGLYIGETNASTSNRQIDVITIGGKYDDSNGDILGITQNQIGDHVFRSSETKELVPLELSITDVEESHVGMFVKLVDVQFSLELEGEPYVDPTDDFDSQRTITSCTDTSSFIMETSSFASFRDITLPTSGKGSISGIINSTYNGYNLVININNPDDVIMDGNRCDPLFFDTFNQGNLDNWTVYSVTGEETWYYNSFGNPTDSATMSGFNGESRANEDWLISKAIDLSNYTTATFAFQSVVRYSGPVLEVYMSTDYNGGNPTTDGTWEALEVTLDANTGSWSSWTNSGEVDVSAAAGGNLYIAFKYTSTTTSSATYEIDNVEVKGE